MLKKISLRKGLFACGLLLLGSFAALRMSRSDAVSSETSKPDASLAQKFAELQMQLNSKLKLENDYRIAQLGGRFGIVKGVEATVIPGTRHVRISAGYAVSSSGGVIGVEEQTVLCDDIRAGDVAFLVLFDNGNGKGSLKKETISSPSAIVIARLKGGADVTELDPSFRTSCEATK